MAETRLVVGLGNPGRQYAGTRHNIGQMVIDELAERASATLSKTKAQARGAVVRLGGSGGLPGPRVVLVKPLTYMNVSGPPVAQLAKFYSIASQHVIAVHDDVDLPFEAIKLKQGGGEGGHNGLRSLTQSLGTKDYLRVRAGVGRPTGRMDTADYVLQRFGAAEQKTLPIFISELADAVEDVIGEGLEATQARFHSR